MNFFQNHVAMGRTMVILQDILESSIHPKEVEKAYLHFEAMTDREYEFKCIDCGYHPSIMIWDTFRKASLYMLLNDFKGNRGENIYCI